MEKTDIILAYKRTGSIKSTVAATGLSHQTVRRILIEAGEFTSPRAELIAGLHEQGLSLDEICAELSLSRSCVGGYILYTRGCQAVGPRSDNALRIEKCRRKKKAEQNKTKPAP